MVPVHTAKVFWGCDKGLLGKGQRQRDPRQMSSQPERTQISKATGASWGRQGEPDVLRIAPMRTRKGAPGEAGASPHAGLATEAMVSMTGLLLDGIPSL